MANEEQLRLLKQGFEGWNKWRIENPDIPIDLINANLENSKLMKIDFCDVNLYKANLQGADLSEAYLDMADLRGADLRKANLEDTHAYRVYLDGAQIGEANLLRASLINSFLMKADLNSADLRLANLSEAYMEDVNLINSKLSGAKLSGADLNRANLSGALLTHSNLESANLIDAKLVEADLSKANLSDSYIVRSDLYKADLSGANLNYANISESNFTEVIMDGTSFGNVDLSNIFGLETIIHRGPSLISLSTLQLSKGSIPDKFLRGCGFSDWEIKAAELYNPNLSNQEINDLQYEIYDLRSQKSFQISPLFISYNHKDSRFVEKLEEHLTESGILFWRDVHHATSGRLEKVVDRAIRHNPTVLIIFSENSIQSDWVQHEVRKAHKLGKETRRDVLCPIALDDSWKNCNWPERIMEHVLEYNILDFSAWEDDSAFKKNFKKLTDGLKLFYSG